MSKKHSVEQNGDKIHKIGTQGNHSLNPHVPPMPYEKDGQIPRENIKILLLSHEDVYLKDYP